MEWMGAQVDNPRFGCCAEFGRFVRAGFVDDVPFYPWTRRYKDARHPLYQKVYEHADKVSPLLARYMDVCICK